MKLHAKLFSSVVAVVLTVGAVAPPALGQASSNSWVGTWATAPDAEPIPSQPTGDRTYREIVHISQGAHEVRAVFSNEFGTTPLTISSAHIALSAGGSRINTETDRELTFNKAVETVIPPGARIVSDPVVLSVPALSSLSVSFYVPSQDIPVLSVHHLGIQTNYAALGNQVAAAVMPTAKQITTYPILRTVEIHPSTFTYAIACLGDSITDGFHSTRDANARWPNVLADRLLDSEHADAPTVLNLGIGGNRLLQTVVGPAALARFDRDITSQSNLTHLIVLEGINDIGEGWKANSTDASPPSAKDLIAAYQQIITRAHSHNITVYGATLLPYKGASYYSDAGEKIRAEVNTWVRDSGAFDGVIDFDKVVADPSHPLMLLPAYDSGDHLHPNDAGYKAMGDSIRLALFSAAR